jgi:hypothetical protein
VELAVLIFLLAVAVVLVQLVAVEMQVMEEQVYMVSL